jgi:hypothetical protein
VGQQQGDRAFPGDRITGEYRDGDDVHFRLVSRPAASGLPPPLPAQQRLDRPALTKVTDLCVHRAQDPGTITRVCRQEAGTSASISLRP